MFMHNELGEKRSEAAINVEEQKESTWKMQYSSIRSSIFVLSAIQVVSSRLIALWLAPAAKKVNSRVQLAIYCSLSFFVHSCFMVQQMKIVIQIAKCSKLLIDMCNYGA